MSIESLIKDVLDPLCANQCYPDIAPQHVTALPRITYQQVGGQAPNFLETAVPDKHNARFQINVWSATRLASANLARAAEAALKAKTELRTTVLGAMVAVYEEETALYGTLQDFSFWG